MTEEHRCMGKCGRVVAREDSWCWQCWSDHDIGAAVAKVVNRERRWNERRKNPARELTGRRKGETQSSLVHRIADAANLLRLRQDQGEDLSDELTTLAHLIAVAQQELVNNKQEKEQEE